MALRCSHPWTVHNQLWCWAWNSNTKEEDNEKRMKKKLRNLCYMHLQYFLFRFVLLNSVGALKKCAFLYEAFMHFFGGKAKVHAQPRPNKPNAENYTWKYTILSNWMDFIRCCCCCVRKASPSLNVWFICLVLLSHMLRCNWINSTLNRVYYIFFVSTKIYKLQKKIPEIKKCTLSESFLSLCFAASRTYRCGWKKRIITEYQP